MAEISRAVKNESKVMVAIDESDYSYYALIWTLDDNLKDSIADKPLVIFAAIPPPNYNTTLAATLGSARMYSSVSSTPELTNAIQEQEMKVKAGLLEKAKAICESKGICAETVIEVGDARVAICSAVEKYDITLLVVGHHGLGKIKSALIGSVGNYCVQNAKCPVLVVKKSE